MSHRREAIQAVLDRHHRDPHARVQTLREAQEAEGWVPRQMLVYIAAGLGITLAQVESVSGFYRFLHRRPVGRYRVLFSDNITDRMAGAPELMQALCRRLNIAAGEVSRDELVSIAATSCTGMGDQAPAALVNHRHVLTRLDADRVVQIAVLIRAQVPVAHWPPAWFEVHDQVRRAEVLLAEGFVPGSALAAAVACGADPSLSRRKTNRRL